MSHLFKLPLLLCALGLPLPIFAAEACESWAPGSFAGLITGRATEREVRAKLGAPRYESNVDRKTRRVEYAINDPFTATAAFSISRKTGRVETITLEVNLWTPQGAVKDGRRMAISLLNSPYVESPFRIVDDGIDNGEGLLVRSRKGDTRRSTITEVIVLEFWRAGATYVQAGGDGFSIEFSTEPYDKAYAPCYRVTKASK